MHTFVQHLSILGKSYANLGIIDGHWTSIFIFFITDLQSVRTENIYTHK